MRLGWALASVLATAAWAEEGPPQAPPSERAPEPPKKAKKPKARKKEEERMRDAVAQQREADREAGKVSRALRWQDEDERESFRTHLKERLDAVARTRFTDKGLTISLPEVFFEGGSRLSPEGRDGLARIAAIAKELPDLAVEVDGRGGFEDAISSQRRAQEVWNSLMDDGLPRSSIAFVRAETGRDAAPPPRGGVEIAVSGDLIAPGGAR
ncbi:MAG TPA: hypothetical protein VNI01_00140 [Elusimicrobiota bacterium]|jgi:outer membrane protein OmpA-like peptidoglycan-associated protein|nr:hypothetical protein [Elusimicrobiota bacterium]